MVHQLLEFVVQVFLHDSGGLRHDCQCGECGAHGFLTDLYMRRVGSGCANTSGDESRVGGGTHVANVDFARMYDSILHVPIVRPMRRIIVPDETRRACMGFEHSAWPSPVAAGVGLRQGCSVA